MQVSNPVPRVRHPDWLHKRLREKSDTCKQRRINEMFSACPKPAQANAEADIEDIGRNTSPSRKVVVASVSKRKRRNSEEEAEELLSKSWREALGNPPPYGTTKVS